MPFKAKVVPIRKFSRYNGKQERDGPKFPKLAKHKRDSKKDRALEVIRIQRRVAERARRMLSGIERLKIVNKLKKPSRKPQKIKQA